MSQDAFCLGIVLHPHRGPGPAADVFVHLAERRDLRLIARPEDAARCPEAVLGVSETELANEADAVVSLGGDGTMLGALRLFAGRPVPIVGVNLGHLGFLVEVQPHELPEAVERLERSEFSIEEHGALVVQTQAEDEVAFNDVAIVRFPGDGVVHGELTVGGQRMGIVRCDGLVLSTPTGSTAYAYAAGGPVVSPALDAIVITLLAPMTGISRPIVVSAQAPVCLTLLQSSGRPGLEIDGSMLTRIEPETTVEIRLEPRAGQVVRLDADRHQRRNLVKLSLLDLPFLPEELRALGPSVAPG